MDSELLLECLKWGGLVLLAGFIGQFGRTLAQRMMRRKKAAADGDKADRDNPIPQEPVAPQLEKKRIKALTKAAKKAAKKGPKPPVGPEGGEG